MKVIKESKKKKKPYMGYFYQMSPGNPEYNAKAFNHVMGTGEMPTEADMGCSESINEAKKKNKYEIIYVTRSDDRTAFGQIEAYSEKQAALLFRRQNKNIFRIVAINCIEDNSIDDGEQLSLF